MKNMKRFAAVLLAAVLSFPGVWSGYGSMQAVKADTCGGLVEKDVYTPEPYEVIQDPILHWAVRAAMNSIEGGVKLTEDMVGSPSVQNISYELCNHPEDFADWTKPYYVESLEGLQYAKSATMIDICYTANIKGKKIDSVQPLAPLTQLEILYLKQDGLNDISPLSGLVNLEQLDVSGNYEIADIDAVKDMKKLKSLNVSMNAVPDLTAVSGLTKLERLNAANNKIQTLPDMSKLTSLNALDLSDNQLKDVSQISSLVSLEELNLSGNSDLTDIGPLVNLKNLKEDATYLPTEQMKTDLFAVIEVNKQFLTFNISKMTKDDIENVEKALETYESLTQNQKSYFDADRVDAAEWNLKLVKEGKEPVYYPEYDEGGEAVPVFSSITIQAVDKSGKPIEGVEFIRKDEYGEITPNSVTDENGKITYKHAIWDNDGSFEIYPAGDTYVAQPEKITYTVDGAANTETVNGKPATGLEELIFTLIPADEYVDKSELQAAILQAGGINQDEGYKYTEDSWNAFKTAWNNANTVNDQDDASKESVTAATEALNTAYNGLNKTDILTKIKIIVKDKNGNLFTRPFKIQVRDADTKGNAWNGFSDAETGIAYMDCPAGWPAGKKWEFLACYEEPYEFDSFVAVTGVKNGKTYFSKVNNQAAGPDFEIEITVRPADKATAVRTPDNTVLKNRIELAKVYDESEYTPGTWNKFQTALEDAKVAAQKEKATQEEYNKAASDLLNAESGLQKKANKTKLAELINEWYTESLFTPDSWAQYIEAKEAASEINANPEATQEQVDQAENDLRTAIAALQMIAMNKPELYSAIEEAKELKKEDYVSGYEELQKVLEEAQQVYDDPEATYAQVEEYIQKIEAAVAALKEKPGEILETCSLGIFRAVVQTEDGKRLPGININFTANGGEPYAVESDDNGIVTYSIGLGDYQKTYTASLAEDQGYVTENVHIFKVGGVNQWITSIEEINGQPYQDGIRLVFTLKEEGQSGEGEEVLSDSKTFRAKVVDENDKPVKGVKFASVPNYEDVDPVELLSNEKGIIEQTLRYEDYGLIFTVSLVPDQEAGQGKTWSCNEEHLFETSYTTTISKIDGKQLAEAGEIVFHLTKDGTDTPSVDKSKLEEKLNEANRFDNSDGKYTEESFQALETAIEEAQGVYDKADAKQTEIDQQVEKLQAAIEGLKESGTSQPGEDKEALEDWISIAGSYLENDYTHESYAKLQEAVTKAKSVLEDSQATKEQIQEACDAIEAAIQGLKPADNPVYCESTIIRIKVVDQNGDRITEDIPFINNTDGSEYNAYFYNGVIEEWLSGAVSGVNTIQIYLKNGSVELDGKQYVTDPEQYEFGLKSGVNGMEINTVDGEPFDASRQLIFTLKEKTEGATVNKEALEAAVTEAEGLTSQKDSYTINSYNEFEAALEKAKVALDAEDIQQSEVDAAAAALELAKNNLKKVTGMRTLTIPVKMEDGSPAPVNVEFVRRSDQYGMNYPIYVDGEGKLTWKLTSGDSGDYIFFLPDTSAYIETPGEIVVHVGSEDGTPVIDTINGVPAAEASVQFTLSAKGTDTCDLTHFRAVVQDNHGNLLSGIKFNVENGDPAELTSDENGVITYEATSWDTDMTMKVALQDGQDWTTDQSMEFSVITDPNDPARGILGTINGQPFQGGEKLVFKLQKIGEVVLDWSVLETAMDKAGKLNPEIYTEETYKQVTEALKAAQNIYGDQSVSQEQINQAAASLEEAILQLQEKPVEPEQPQYSIIQGAGQQVTADQDAVFASSADYNKFVKVLIDGVELSADNYVVTEGSTVVTLKKEYVATLAEGTHTISIVSTDGIASTEFTVKKNQDVKPGDSDNTGDADSKNPSQNNGNTQTRPAGNISARTGDNSPVMIWAALAAAAVCLIAGITIIRRKKQ